MVGVQSWKGAVLVLAFAVGISYRGEGSKGFWREEAGIRKFAIGRSPEESHVEELAAYGRPVSNRVFRVSAKMTLDELNDLELLPGDRVLFECGGVWRGQLQTRSGKPGHPVVYGSYGVGAKPVIQTSMARDRMCDWQKSDGLWVAETRASADIGNIVFDHGERGCAFKKCFKADVRSDLDFWCDPQTFAVYLKSERNPAERFSSIELCEKVHCVEQWYMHDVVYDGLCVRYTGAHGFAGGGVKRIVIRNCDLCWIGGGYLYYDKKGNGVRFGNGIEFWGSCEDNQVVSNRLWEIWDAALTNQSNEDGARQRNLVWRGNEVWNSEYSYEYWQQGVDAKTENVIVEGNRFRDAGKGWGHLQRWNPNAAHLMFYDTTADTKGFVVANNDFSRSEDCLFRLFNDWRSSLEMKDNRWVSAGEPICRFHGRPTHSLVYRYPDRLDQMHDDNLAEIESQTVVSPRVFAANELAAFERFFGHSDDSWTGSVWLSVPEAPVFRGEVKDGVRATDGVSWFTAAVTNGCGVKKAVWTVAGLGVFDAYVNGRRVGTDFLKPGFTHNRKTKYSFSYDVTDLMLRDATNVNFLAAEVSAGWWREKICSPWSKDGFVGKKSAFRGVLELTFDDGTVKTLGTNCCDWRCGIAGPVVHASIFDGEEYDARRPAPYLGEGLVSVPEENGEFTGEILPSAGAEVCLREDLAMVRGPLVLKCGATNVVDFGQNCAAVPAFRFRAKPGTELVVRPGEMLNDADPGERGCDGPKGSVYRANLRAIKDDGALARYTFGSDGWVEYMPRHTFFGYRYLDLRATGDVEIEWVRSVPVTSIRKEMELGTIETGDAALNRFIRNVYWGQLSNYLSVPTDCPQRNERLGWSADTQVFAEAGAYNADTLAFLRKWMCDMRDSRDEEGGFPSVAPFAQYGNETFRLGWADAGVIVPYRMWKMFGSKEIVEENFEAMAKFVRKLDETKYVIHVGSYEYADWLSFETFETCGNKFGDWKKWKNDPDARNYREFLAASYWLMDARMMVEMAEAIGREGEAAFFRGSADRALDHLRTHYLDADGLLLKPMRALQTACVFALKTGVVTGSARTETLALLKKNIREHDGCLQTGFLGTALIMDVLTDEGAVDQAYALLLNHRFPSWLYSVDQGATTVWERWNSYTKADGFGPVEMNSFNHYAYGAVLAWLYRTVAGIAPLTPGFGRILLAPRPDRRLGRVAASYRTPVGTVKSRWTYEGKRWVWRFTVPAGAEAVVRVPGEQSDRTYAAGEHCLVKEVD